MESFMNSANCTSEETAAVVPCVDTLNDSLDEICSQSALFSSPTSDKQKPSCFELGVGFKEGKVADSPGGILPSLPTPRPLSQQAALLLNTVDNKNNDESTQPTASPPEQGPAITSSQPSASQTTSATKFVPSFGKKGPPKSKPKKTDTTAAVVTKSQPAPTQPDEDTASSMEGQLANEQGDTAKQTPETQASKIKKKASSQNQMTKEEKNKLMALKKQEKEQKKAEKEMLKIKKQIEKEEKQAEKERKKAEKERKQAEKEQKQAEKQAEKKQKQAEKEQKQAEKEQKQAEKQAEKEQKQAEKEQKQAEKQAEKKQKQAEKEQKQAEKEQEQAEKEQKQAEKEQEQAEKEQEQAENEQKQAEKEQKQTDKQVEKEQKEVEKRQRKEQLSVKRQKEEESESSQTCLPVELIEMPAPSMSENENEAATETCSAAPDLPADDLPADNDIPTTPCDAARTSEHNIGANSSKPLGEHEDEEPTQVTSADKKNLLTSQQEGKQDRKNKIFKPPLVKAGTKRSSLPEDQQPAKKKVRKTQQSNKSNQKNRQCRKSEERVASSNTVGPLWVQCDHPGCLKWRVMKGVTDPALIPDKWYCSMNTDPKYNSCTVPEQVWSDPGEDEEFVYSQYVPGSIVWAKLEGFPWWPAMVEEDPDCESYYETNGSSTIPVKCHVVFLDTPVSRAWVHTLNIQSFTEDSKVPQKCTSLLMSAFKDAHKALEMTMKERLDCYGFMTRYKKQHHSATRQKRARSPTASTSSNKARKITSSKRSRRDTSADQEG